MIDRWLEKMVAEVWEESGEVLPFPRELEHFIACNKRVNVDALPDLSVAAIRNRLSRLPHTFGLDVRNRRLYGCLVAYHGGGTIFVEARLAPSDRRVIVAHEFGHFLADYESPRRRGERRIGPQLLQIFDGERAPTDIERLEATLAGVDLRSHVHYMERTEYGTYRPATSHVEQRANDLALELLAPWREATELLRGRGRLPATLEPWIDALVGVFGLPAGWARPYAERLHTAALGQRSFTEILGL